MVFNIKHSRSLTRGTKMHTIRSLEKQLDKIRQQLRQEEGYPFALKQLGNGLQALRDGRFEAIGGLSRSWIHAADLIPEGYTIIEDVQPIFDLRVTDLRFVGFLQDKHGFIAKGIQLRERAIALKANLGLADARNILIQQNDIPANLRGSLRIVFTGTIVRRPDGGLSIALLWWNGDCISCRWSIYFMPFNGYWRDCEYCLPSHQ